MYYAISVFFVLPFICLSEIQHEWRVSDYELITLPKDFTINC